ncbi:MAG: 4Fe-4S dicluster domain-containing protein [Bacteriovoracaceae bacterium]|nr:4Fe-4S dicluster domain-containing protein [Bacteriovoracaceae bacterium]
MSDNKNDKTCGTSCGCGTPVEGYWQDVENKLPTEAKTQEFADGEFDSFSIKKDRRSFLKIMGFSVSALPLTGCVKIPVRKAIPYLEKNPTQYPGVANYYSTTFEGSPVMIKVREGRPIKAEGNKLSTVTEGGTDAQIQASILDLYDSNRLRSASIDGKDVEWDVFDNKLKSAISKASGKKVLVTKNVTSPSQLKMIAELESKLGFDHVVYEPVSRYGINKANERAFGAFAPNAYFLEDADTIVSFGADFLGTFGNNLQQSRDYSKRRVPTNPKGLNKHIHVEAVMTLTGSNADSRYTRSIQSQRAVLGSVYAGITGDTAGKSKLSEADQKLADFVVKQLKSSKTSVLMSDDNNVDVQLMVAAINKTLGNYGKTIKVIKTDAQYANDEQFNQLVKDMAAGKVGVAMFLGTNPAYNFHDPKAFVEAASKVSTKVSFALSADETSSLCNFVAPDNHTYESWSDSMGVENEVSFTQPVIQPLFGSRMAMETLMALLNKEGTFHDYMVANWKKNIYPAIGGFSNFDNFWNKALHDGVVKVDRMFKEVSYRNVSANASANAVKNIKYGEGLNVVVYQKFAIRDGAMANNPLLHEMPDPITKATWDNYIMVSPSFAKANSIKSGDVVKVDAGTYNVTLPAAVIPGIEANTVGVALGYGRTRSGKVGTGMGANAFPFATFVNGSVDYNTSFGKLTKTGAHRGLALSQTHQSMEGRDIVRETTYEKFEDDNGAGNKPKMKLPQIYPVNHQLQEGHQWAMAIDLNTCTGCSTCVVACNTENNVPVVGRTEVHRRRDMHWMRIDRYFAGDEQEPETVHMPMLCQHCENAPCENVCPVLATVHSSDGLNQQVYNRCIGTRYCANNCPYKVRRFNWFNYDHSDEYARLALNPDVSVRSRGVMEKCSFCIQRIQEGKLKAKRERRDLQPGDIQTACQQSCPTNAIVFGDMNDKNSPIAKLLENPRTYSVLEELNVKPRVNYMVKVRNKSEEEA